MHGGRFDASLQIYSHRTTKSYTTDMDILSSEIKRASFMA